MLALKVGKKNAEKAKLLLLESGVLPSGFKVLREGEFVFFPVIKKTRLPFVHSFVQKKFREIEKTKSLKEALESVLSEKELQMVVSSFDVVGSVALVEIPVELENKEKRIAEVFLENNKHVKTVLKKVGSRKGVFRLKEYKWLAGKKTFETIHKESGCLFKVNLPKAYFSSRLVSERQRIASLVKNGERILALFAGVGPFPIVIAREKNVFIKAVELNPSAVVLFKENVLLNKLRGKIEVFEGDALVFSKKFGKWADRILMTLPYGSEEFLGGVVENAKKGCVIHYYNLGGEEEGVFKNALKEIALACKKKKRKFSVLRKKIVLPYAPRVFHIVIDFKVL